MIWGVIWEPATRWPRGGPREAGPRLVWGVEGGDGAGVRWSERRPTTQWEAQCHCDNPLCVPRLRFPPSKISPPARPHSFSLPFFPPESVEFQRQGGGVISGTVRTFDLVLRLKNNPQVGGGTLWGGGGQAGRGGPA